MTLLAAKAVPTRPAPPVEIPRRAGPRGRAAWRQRVPIFLGIAVLTHLPGFVRPLWNPDEGFLATQAAVLNDGGELYESAVDRKPPVLPYLYAVAARITGTEAIWPMRALGVLAHLATALILAAIARRRLGERAGFAAGGLYLVASAGLAPEDAHAASFEVFMLPWMCASVLLAGQRRTTAAGAALAVATLTKQTAGVTLLPLLWLAWRAGRGRGVAGLIAGFALPVAVVALAVDAHEFVFWVLTSNESYLNPHGSWLLAIARGFGNFGIVAAANLVLVLLLARAWRYFRHVDTDLWLWLASAVIGVSAGFHFFGHYFLQLLPPLVLLAVSALARARWAVWRATFGFGAASALVFGTLALAWPTGDVARIERVAAAIRAHTESDDRVLVWGMNPEVYWVADRRPATRFITVGFLTNFSGGREKERVGERYAIPGTWEDFERDVAAGPPALIVDDSRGAGYGPAQFPRVRELLTGYERVATVDGTVLYAPR